MVQQVSDVGPSSGEEVVHTQNVTVALKELLAQSGANEAGPSGHEDAFPRTELPSGHADSERFQVKSCLILATAPADRASSSSLESPWRTSTKIIANTNPTTNEMSVITARLGLDLRSGGCA